MLFFIYIILYHTVGINLKVKLIFAKYVTYYEDVSTDYNNSLRHVHIIVSERTESIVQLKVSCEN